MDVELSEDESGVALAFEEMLARESSIDRVRAAEPAGFDPALWKVLTGVGAVTMALPEQAGGAGGGLVALVLAAEAAGRHLACVPLVEAAAAALVLAAAGNGLGGDSTGGGASSGSRAGGNGTNGNSTNEDSTSGSGWGELASVIAEAGGDGPPVVLAPSPARDGVAVAVPGGAAAVAVVVLDGDELVLVHGAPPGGGGGDLGYLAVASRSLRGDGVRRTVLATGDRAWELWDSALGWWRIGTAATCTGLAVRAIEIGSEYARSRYQFGVPIGSFQAIQQMLVDPAMAADGAVLLAREAAWRYDNGLASWRAAADIAYAQAAEAAVRAAEACLHVHGGYGYTLEYDAQLYLRRAKALVLLGGDPEAIWAGIGAASMSGEATGEAGTGQAASAQAVADRIGTGQAEAECDVTGGARRGGA